MSVFTANVRLTGGLVPNEGRIEMYIADQSKWMTICADDWDKNNSIVACRSLGLPPPTWTFDYSPFYDKMAYFVRPLNCAGNEGSLLECPVYEEWSNYCSNKGYPASVICGKPAGNFKYNSTTW